MDRPKKKATSAGLVPLGWQESILVSMEQGAGMPALVAVEWHDGAGELHHADLCTGPDDLWCLATGPTAAPK